MSERESSFFVELKRRNVFRVALTYAVVAWLLIEIASVLLQTVDAPTWIISAFLVLLALGFAVALFISWAFEMTPEGLKRTEELSPDEVIPYWSRRKFARFIIGMAVIAFGLSAYQLLVSKRAATVSRSAPDSISAQSTAGSQSEKASDTQPVERILRDLDAQWSKAAAAKDVEQTIAYYSDEATVFPPNAIKAATLPVCRSLQDYAAPDARRYLPALSIAARVLVLPQSRRQNPQVLLPDRSPQAGHEHASGADTDHSAL